MVLNFYDFTVSSSALLADVKKILWQKIFVMIMKFTKIFDCENFEQLYVGNIGGGKYWRIWWMMCNLPVSTIYYNSINYWRWKILTNYLLGYIWRAKFDYCMHGHIIVMNHIKFRGVKFWRIAYNSFHLSKFPTQNVPSTYGKVLWSQLEA